MKSLIILATALSYIEENISYDVKNEEIAKACYCSKSSLEKLFQCTYKTSIHNYIINRRMTLAAKTIKNNPDMNLLDVAVMYGYGSNEAFTRAFRQIWNCTPVEFRTRDRFTALYPGFTIPMVEGDAYVMERRPVDITELYDLFLQRKDCYFVCCDIKHMEPINEISMKAGDLAIITALERMNAVAGNEDIVFRIGGDEFAMITDNTDITYAEGIAEALRNMNGQTFAFDGQDIPLNMHVAVTKFEGNTLRYQKLFSQLHIAIDTNKKY